MNRYEEFTPEEIESLAKECERLADENSVLQDRLTDLQELNLQLLAALKAQAAVSLPLDCVKAAIAKAEGQATL